MDNSQNNKPHEPNQEETMETAATVDAESAKETKRQPEQVTISDIELEKLKQEAGDYKQKYLRLLADAENARKRLQKDRDEIVQYTIRGILSDFLNPIDHLENALKYTENASGEVKHWAAGFKMILNQFKDVLSNNGVKPFTALGKEFDPHLHDAVEMIETDEFPPGIVVEESTRGYAIGDKTLRPSRVKVSKAPVSKDATAPENDEAKS